MKKKICSDNPVISAGTNLKRQRHIPTVLHAVTPPSSMMKPGVQYPLKFPVFIAPPIGDQIRTAVKIDILRDTSDVTRYRVSRIQTLELYFDVRFIHLDQLIEKAPVTLKDLWVIEDLHTRPVTDIYASRLKIQLHTLLSMYVPVQCMSDELKQVYTEGGQLLVRSVECP